MAAPTVAEKLRNLGVRGVLVQMAERGQLIELRCEMPSCYCPLGRRYFAQRDPASKPWAPSLDHYPVLKSKGGHRSPSNARLSHVLCNREDHGRRARIGPMLEDGRSLAEIAEHLEATGVRRPHGTASWSAAAVRAVIVS